MVDLHLHLDGSLSAEFVLEQAEKDGIVLPANNVQDLMPYLTVGDTCESLNEYLEKFDLPLSVLQTENALEKSVYDLMKRLDAEGVEYAEIRYAPQLHLQRGLAQEAVVEATLSGLNSAIRDYNIDGKLILCCMRMADNQSANMQTVEVAKRYLGRGVAAIDLAGAEALFPTKNFEQIFRRASMYDIPFTIHAGEADGPESIRDALRFGATRIGHGVRCIEDSSLVDELIKRQIPLEVCPISNAQTKACPDIAHHPILKLLDYGVCVTVNTDNRTVSNTNLNKEFDALYRELHMTDSQKEKLNKNSLSAKF